MPGRLFTSESVTEGHPDKIADQISDTVLDYLLEHDPKSRVAVETLLTTGLVVVAGEVTTEAYAPVAQLVREKILEIGYDSSDKGFDGTTCGVQVAIGAQSSDIAAGVDAGHESRVGSSVDELDLRGDETALDAGCGTGQVTERLLERCAHVIALDGSEQMLTVARERLGDERVTVAEDASWFAGEKVDGPLTAYAEADIIEKHALESSGGKTYAELDREDPARASVMNGSFLRASLFTSVVSFGIAAMAMGLGVVFGLIGIALRTIGKSATV